MESKLKSLKVADLRDILAKANQPPPQKSTKTDLVSRILASKEATQEYNAKFAPKDDLLAPPEDLDWDVDQVNPPAEPSKPHAAKPETAAAKPAPKTATQSTQAPAPAPASVAAPAAAPLVPAPVSSAAAPTDDAELEKRKKRAERFGIPLVESRSSTAKKKGAAAPAATVTAPEVPDKLQARAARFVTGQKRAAPLEEVDAEELERRRKRAERFGQQG